MPERSPDHSDAAASRASPSLHPQEPSATAHTHELELVVALDGAGVVTFVSDACRSLLHCDPADLVGTRFLDLVHPDDRPRHRLEDPAACGTALARREVLRVRRGDGTHIWAQVDFRHVAQVAAPAEIVAVLRDITQRRCAEDQLRQSEERFRGSFEAAAHGMALVSTAGRWLEVNRALCEIVGYAESELLQTDFQTITHLEDLDKDLELLEQLLAGGIAHYQMEKRYFHKLGHIVWVQLSVSLVRDAQGRPVHFVSQVIDITAAREAQRTLREAKEEAERTAAQKSAFVATMSHELRTPMSGVLGFADILLRTQLTAEQRRAVTLLRDAGTSLLAIINDVLDLSKIEAGKLRLEAIPTDLRDLVDSAVSIVRSQAAAKGLELRIEMTDDLPASVEADPVRLRQVLLNLLSNAVKFTEGGHVRVRVGRAADQPAAFLFEVEDTGIGIAGDALGQLFQEFTQLDRSTTRRYGGTGLGLAIAKRLIEAMPDGRIGVESEPGCGTRFWFTVSLPTVVAAAAPAKAAGSNGGGPSRAARVLLAEDNYINQVVIEQMLKGAGHHLVIVGDGRAAVEAVERQAFDLVVMDMEMPVMDGISATRAIRALPEPVGSVPILALTANALAEQAARCIEAGMNAHLAKPIDQDALLRAIADWARRSDLTIEVVDTAVVDDLVTRVGHAKHIDLLRLFSSQLEHLRTVMANGDVAAIGRDAHAMASAAGFLGFKELMQRSRELMTAIGRGGDVAPMLAAARDALTRAEAIVAARRRAAA